MKSKQPQKLSLYQFSSKQQTVEPRTRRKIQPFSNQQVITKMSIDFKYNFQDYLKMALSKLIPHQGIIIDPQQGLIYGEKDECIKFKRKVQKEFTSKKYKKIQFKKEVDLDQIEYQLHPKYQARIFRPGYIQRALQSLSNYQKLEYTCRKFKDMIKKTRTIILRLKSDYESQCMQNIESILKKYNENNEQIHSNNTNNRQVMEQQSYQQIIDEQANYYQIKSHLTNKQRILQQINQSHITIDDSQFNLTKTNSSQFMDQQQEIPNEDYSRSINRSFT